MHCVLILYYAYPYLVAPPKPYSIFFVQPFSVLSGGTLSGFIRDCCCLLVHNDVDICEIWRMPSCPALTSTPPDRDANVTTGPLSGGFICRMVFSKNNGVVLVVLVSSLA